MVEVRPQPFMKLFHVLNRGVEKRTIFLDGQDYRRFIHNLYECNDVFRIDHGGRSFSTMAEVGPRPFRSRNPRKMLVDIHGWCLMKNHFHLILSLREERGISRFMQKVNTAYVMYFNQKYKRSGALFQGKTKKIPIESEAHFYHILHYVHLNPLDYLDGALDWRERTIDDADTALAHLKKYKWSSYLDYCGIKNFPSIISHELFGEVFADYDHELSRYLKSIVEWSRSDLDHSTI